MCGLAGAIVEGSTCTIDLEELAGRMASRLVHRGPDAAGIWAEDGIALSHRRLAIVDLSKAGAQPMSSACGRFVIAYNGEVYNHMVLRRDLQATNRYLDWRGHSDTETLLAAFATWGVEETLRRAEGMFAIALWDRQERRLTLARDRMGEKPLYWGWAQKTLLFGSELKALRAHPECPAAICPDAFAQYVTLGYVPAPFSIHPGLYKLEPGCFLQVSCEGFPSHPPLRPLRPGDSYGSMILRRYWSLDEVTTKGRLAPIRSEAEALAKGEATLIKAVEQQMMADVPIGAFLSGGIDSSLIVALMQRQSSRPVRTFTVGFDSVAHDESPYADAVAKHLGTDHTCLQVTQAEARDVIPALPDLYDEPFADSSQIPMHLVCRAARQSVSVALSGDGGDELFGGYNRHIHGPKVWRRLALIPAPLRTLFATAIMALPKQALDSFARPLNALRSPASRIAALGQKAHRLADRISRLQSVDGLYHDSISIWPKAGPLLAHGLRAKASQSASIPLLDPVPACLQDDPAGRMMLLDMRGYLPDDILCKVDRAAMATSLETRVPFLDPNVIGFSAQVPLAMKIRGGEGKWLLRQILYRHVPPELIDRPKTGFSVPLADWLRGPLRAWAEGLLSPEAMAVDGLFDPAPIQAAWQDHLGGRTDRSAQLWVILMFQAWRAANR